MKRSADICVGGKGRFSLGAVVVLLGFGLFLSSCSLCEREPSPSEEIDTYSPDEQRFLLGLARETVTRYVTGRPLPEVDPAGLSGALREERACFVTLNHVDKGLRGCMGYLTPTMPLYRCVIDRAVTAATRDPRFPPVRPEELERIEFEVSVLTVPRELAVPSADALLQKLRPRIDGVILKTRYGGATFLPQVWEDLPEPEVFLGRLCRKHGAPFSCWREPGVHVLIYQASVFAEKGQSEGSLTLPRASTE